jgi:hypothetical protein
MKPRHTLLPALALLALALFARADDLQVKGAGVKQVVVADAAPFTVSAPPNALLYFWTFPAGVTADGQGRLAGSHGRPEGHARLYLQGDHR